MKELIAHHEASFEGDSQNPSARTDHVQNIQAQIVAQPTRTDHSLLKGMRSSGVLNDEPVLASELELIVEGKGVRNLSLQFTLLIS